MRLVIFLLFAVLSSVASAASADRAEKVRAIMVGQGQMAMFEYSIQTGKENTRNYTGQIITQMVDGLNPSPEYQAKIKAATDAFLTEMNPPWSADDYLKVWADYYGANFTDEELDQLLKFYTSPVALKESVVQRETIAKFDNYFQQHFKSIWDSAIKSFGERMKNIAKDCKCPK